MLFGSFELPFFDTSLLRVLLILTSGMKNDALSPPFIGKTNL